MERHETTNPGAACGGTHCSLCALCKAVNYEEQRLPAKEIKSEIKTLYGAEALSYYFYFSSKRSSASAKEEISLREAV